MDAFLFPGQGAQRPGMGVAWQHHSSWRVVEELSSVTGRDIGHLLTAADADELKVTANAQLATFTLCLVIFDAVRTATACDGAGAGAGRG
ncbi:MAG: ACP S-malonyltransferase, partial [Acidimicrobiales bacterium]